MYWMRNMMLIQMLQNTDFTNLEKRNLLWQMKNLYHYLNSNKNKSLTSKNIYLFCKITKLIIVFLINHILEMMKWHEEKK